MTRWVSRTPTRMMLRLKRAESSAVIARRGGRDRGVTREKAEKRSARPARRHARTRRRAGGSPSRETADGRARRATRGPRAPHMCPSRLRRGARRPVDRDTRTAEDAAERREAVRRGRRRSVPRSRVGRRAVPAPDAAHTAHTAHRSPLTAHRPAPYRHRHRRRGERRAASNPPARLGAGALRRVTRAPRLSRP